MRDFVAIPEERIKILRDKRSLYTRKLRDFFDVQLWIKDVEVEIEGEDSLQVIRTKEILKAFGRGFEFEDALGLADEDFVLELINTSEFAGKSKNRRKELKGRVIGAEGKSKDMIEKYSGAKVVVYGKTVGILGKWENVIVAKKAVEMLLNGAKHTTVFMFLEEKRVV